MGGNLLRGARGPFRRHQGEEPGAGRAEAPFSEPQWAHSLFPAAAPSQALCMPPRPAKGRHLSVLGDWGQTAPLPHGIKDYTSFPSAGQRGDSLERKEDKSNPHPMRVTEQPFRPDCLVFPTRG